MITDNIEQRSLDWHRMRCGCITGSKVADLMKSGRKEKMKSFPTRLNHISFRLPASVCSTRRF